MAETEKIEIEIVLNDGTVQKAFAKFKKESKESTDESKKYFDGLLDGANSSVGDFVGALKNVPASFVAIGAAVAAVGVGIQKAFNLAIEGERIDSIYNQFEVLSLRAGLAGDQMKNALEQAAGGFVDLEGVIKTANVALGEMGPGAARLPELLTVARQAAVLYGGSIEDYFEKLNQAVLSGNTKVLKSSMNLFVDSKDAIDVYSKQHGKLAKDITTTGERQAVLNAILKQAQDSFSGVDLTQTSVTLSQQKLSTSLGEIGDAMAKLSQSAFGTILRDFALAFADFTNQVTGLAPEAQTKLGLLDQEIGKLNESIKAKNEQLKENARERTGIFEEIFDPQVDPRFFEAKLDELNKQLEKKMAERQAIIDANKPVAAEPEFKVDEKAISERNSQILALISQQNAAEIGLAQTRAMQLGSVEEQRLAMAQVFAEQESQMRIEQAQKLAEIDRQFTEANGFTTAQAQAARLAVIETYNAKVEQAHAENAIKLNKMQIVSTESMKSIVVNGLSNQMQIVGQNLQKGVGLFDQFGSGVVGIIADMIINVGNALLAQGLAIESFIKAINALLPGSGFAAAAAGAALVIFGSALKASVAGKSNAAPTTTPTAPSISNGTGAAETTTGTEVANVAPIQERERRADTSVVVNIAGDVYDSDASGGRIVDLINSAFDKNGVTIRRGVMA